jgi:RimJ/RimL family protein N-acetyltransferase
MHIDGLVVASAVNPPLYRWSPVPQGRPEVAKYVETALVWKQTGTSVPFAIIRLVDGTVVGSTRFWNLEKWLWPTGHPSHRPGLLDACEIGYAWLTQSSIRTGTNKEVKLLMLTYAFEEWLVLRVCFYTGVRNQRSCAALERLGDRFERVFRAHRIAADHTIRDLVRFSIVAAKWPTVKQRLLPSVNQRINGAQSEENTALKLRPRSTISPF